MSLSLVGPQLLRLLAVAWPAPFLHTTTSTVQIGGRCARTQQLGANPPPFIPCDALDIENNDGHDWRPRIAWSRLLANAGHCLSPGWEIKPEEIAAAKPANTDTDTDKIGYRLDLIAVVVSQPLRRLQFLVRRPPQCWASSSDCPATSNHSNDNRTTRKISPVPSFILKFRRPPKSKDRHRNSSLFRWIRRTNRRNKEADQLMSWSDIAPLYGHFGTDWVAMEATEAVRSSNSSCFRTAAILPSGSSPERRLLHISNNLRSSADKCCFSVDILYQQAFGQSQKIKIDKRFKSGY